MTQKWVRAALMAAFGVAAVVVAGGTAVTADDKKEKLPDISEIMKKAHGKTDGYLGKIGKAAKGGKWEDAQKAAKEQSILAVALEKNDPPKGDKKSWEKLTKAYTESSKKIEEGAKKEDAKAVTDNLGMIFKSCKGCHDSHK